MRSSTVSTLRRCTSGGEGSQFELNRSGRLARPAPSTSRMPLVVTSPVFAPRRSMIAFVAIVDPCLNVVISPGCTPAFASAFITPSMKPGGVDGVLTVVSSCVSSS
jgi:hypothetical protein